MIELILASIYLTGFVGFGIWSFISLKDGVKGRHFTWPRLIANVSLMAVFWFVIGYCMIQEEIKYYKAKKELKVRM